MNRKSFCRAILYGIGLLLLALGLTLNTKAGLGVSPIISVAYTVSVVSGFSFGDMTLIWYSLFVAAELALHALQKKGRAVLIKDLLQLPLSIVFTRFLNLFGNLFPDYATVGSMPVRLIVLAAALVLTGIGAAMSVDMRLVPNPGDGIVQTLSDTLHIEMGLMKNVFDVCCLLTASLLGVLLTGHVVGVGIGTVIAMLSVGRVIALFNKLFLKKLKKISGQEA